jgi:hypothetical protein
MIGLPWRYCTTSQQARVRSALEARLLLSGFNHASQITHRTRWWVYINADDGTGAGHDAVWAQKHMKALALLKPVLKYGWGIFAQLLLQTWSQRSISS